MRACAIEKGGLFKLLRLRIEKKVFEVPQSKKLTFEI